MNAATQTLDLSLSRKLRQSGSLTAIGARLWLRIITSIKARMAAAAAVRAERELLALAAQYDESMPSFAAELRAANSRRG
jgi:hypothetical protein